MPAAGELVAFDRSEEEVGRIINADWLAYQRLEDLIESAREGNPAIGGFECSVFDGDYITGGIDQGYLARLSADRNDQMKQRRERQRDRAVIELHNHA